MNAATAEARAIVSSVGSTYSELATMLNGVKVISEHILDTSTAIAHLQRHPEIADPAAISHLRQILEDVELTLRHSSVLIDMSRQALDEGSSV